MRNWLFPNTVDREYQALLQAYANDVSQETYDALVAWEIFSGKDKSWSEDLTILLGLLAGWAVGHSAKVITALPDIYAKINRFNDKQFLAVVKDGTRLVLSASNANDMQVPPVAPRITTRPSGATTPLELDGIRIPPVPPRPSNEGMSEPGKITVRLGRVDVYREEPWLVDLQTNWVAQNVSLIKSISTQSLEKVQVIVRQGVMQGTAPSEIARQIQELTGVTNRRATLIARDQTGKANAALSEHRMTDIGITEYYWTTAHDERVRPAHVESDGDLLNFESGNPKDNNLNPGQPIQCRCWARPKF
jgi:SPP1 gp7 family putative phage head morphogenesis protein